MQTSAKKSDEQWIPLETLMTFNKCVFAHSVLLCVRVCACVCVCVCVCCKQQLTQVFASVVNQAQGAEHRQGRDRCRLAGSARLGSFRAEVRIGTWVLPFMRWPDPHAADSLVPPPFVFLLDDPARMAMPFAVTQASQSLPRRSWTTAPSTLTGLIQRQSPSPRFRFVRACVRACVVCVCACALCVCVCASQSPADAFSPLKTRSTLQKYFEDKGFEPEHVHVRRHYKTRENKRE